MLHAKKENEKIIKNFYLNVETLFQYQIQFMIGIKLLVLIQIYSNIPNAVSTQGLKSKV